MVKFYTTIEVYIDQSNEEELRHLCFLNDLELEESVSIGTYDLQVRANKIFEFDMSKRFWINGKAPQESILRILNDADFDIGVKMDL